jgi:hypothetical protein
MGGWERRRVYWWGVLSVTGYAAGDLRECLQCEKVCLTLLHWCKAAYSGVHACVDYMSGCNVRAGHHVGVCAKMAQNTTRRCAMVTTMQQDHPAACQQLPAPRYWHSMQPCLIIRAIPHAASQHLRQEAPHLLAGHPPAI